MLENTKFVVFPLIERLITKTNLDRMLAMILASKLLFLTEFVQKLDE